MKPMGRKPKLWGLWALLLALALLFTTACGDAPSVSASPSGDAETPTESGAPASSDAPISAENPVHGGVILHAWSWSFDAIAENMADIAGAGYAAVQTSPVSRCITTSNYAPGKSSGNEILGDGAWWFHYQPVAFQIGNYQLGTEQDFEDMCAVAREHGVKVIVDAVVNHMSADRSQILDEVKNLEGGAFHEDTQAINDWNDRRQLTQRRLLGLWDLNTQNPVVQQEVLRYLKRCVALGASGFRYDAAKHIELPVPEDHPSFASDFWPVVLDNGSEFQYGEILGGGDAYTKYMSVTDSIYGSFIANAIRNGRFSAIGLQGYFVEAPPEKLVTWVESHDTYCNEGETANLTPRQILYGWAVLASREGSTPLYFNRPAGSAGRENRWGDNIIGAKGNDEFKSAEVSALNHFKKAMSGKDEHFSNPTGDESLLMIERGDAGAVVVNAGGQAQIDADSRLTDGAYTDQISGGAFTVRDGKLTGEVGAESVAVLLATE